MCWNNPIGAVDINVFNNPVGTVEINSRSANCIETIPYGLLTLIGMSTIDDLGSSGEAKIDLSEHFSRRSKLRSIFSWTL